MGLTQYNNWEPVLDAVNGRMQQEPRVFAHDAVPVVIGAINNSNANHGLRVIDKGSTYAPGDVITLTTVGGATVAAEVTVLAVDANDGVTDYEVTTVGAGYAVGHVETDSDPAGAFEVEVINIDIPHTQKRGCCLYVGANADVEVIMEGVAGSTPTVTFKGVAAGSFLPVLVKQVVSGIAAPGDILALY